MRHKYLFPIPLLLLSVACVNKPSSVSENDVVELNLSNYTDKRFKMSDLVDSIAIIELSPDYPFMGIVSQITSDRMIIDDLVKEFRYYDHDGNLIGEIGEIGQGGDEYMRATAYSSINESFCLWDNVRNSAVVYTPVATKRGLRLKYYNPDGSYRGSMQLQHPYPEKASENRQMSFNNGYYYFSGHPAKMGEGSAVLCFDKNGRLVFEIPNQPDRMIYTNSRENPTNHYRDHLLMWGCSDTIYEVRGRTYKAAYTWYLDESMRRPRPIKPGSIEPDELWPDIVLDTKEWLIIKASFSWPVKHKYYFYNKSERCLYGDEPPYNDLGYFDMSSIPFDGYYYDEAKDEEWLYVTAKVSDWLVNAWEKYDHPKGYELMKRYNITEDSNPVLIKARLKKSNSH